MNNEKYIKSIHRLGRLGSIGALGFMVGIPLVICAIYSCFPDFGLVLQSGTGLLAMFIPIAISEVFSYAPVLGSASYITFITGNVMNLKLPVAINAIDIAGVEQSTDEGDAVVTVAVGASSIVTMAIIALGVILLVPLQPIFAIPAVKTATGYMLPALFGGLALGIFNGRSGKYNIKGKLLGAVPAVIIVIILMIMGVPLSTYQGFVIVGMIPVTILTSWLMYKKGIIKVYEQGKTEPEPVASKK
ncbi:hypothetical protein KQI11_01000 [Acetanaerobacterium sp. MSJ-12]|uniref:Uncharacterized protein n=1 Tax=Bittarella massiliensis (ex Durand et al. 2017) TaxID=1720313 RepID=A0AAQ1MCY5_9FIRM|nr:MULTISPECIES: hypothetical protein [Eubacteriales]MCB5940127.1 hypothetical protein [bacterium 210820-DFI.6.52]ERI96139.1 hypothetical protein HMPREF0262_03655 [Clostridium sp. ATCC 29733]MBU5418701.1 hypothetical protein [Acetanaerobacterium sp. MSJ-12]MZL68821.1 hypothetical protein [Bittarella massiliensis (ex Durand et al. 2017)]MZL80159.1 hypothetical protein [Bittarella massiliensis (ex Durand et al. 2017)]